MINARKVIEWTLYQVFKFKYHINKTSIGIILPFGLGDTYLVFTLIDDYRRINGYTSVVVFLKPGHDIVAKYFSNDKHIRLVVTDNIDNLVNIARHYGCQLNGEIFICHPHFYNQANLTNYIGYKHLTLLDIYKIFLNLPTTAIIRKPHRDESLNETLSRRYNRMGLLKGRTVILFPEANSIKELPIKTWITISNHYSKQGYKVVYYAKNSAIQIRNAEYLNIPLQELRSIATYSGTVVCLRSGISDLLADTNIRLIVIYPRDKWYSSTVLEGSSLIRMGTSVNALEIEVSRSMTIDNSIAQFLI